MSQDNSASGRAAPRNWVVLLSASLFIIGFLDIWKSVSFKNSENIFLIAAIAPLLLGLKYKAGAQLEEVPFIEMIKAIVPFGYKEIAVLFIFMSGIIEILLGHGISRRSNTARWIFFIYSPINIITNIALGDYLKGERLNIVSEGLVHSLSPYIYIILCLMGYLILTRPRALVEFGLAKDSEDPS